MRARVIALGQPAAGDDGVGLAVLEALRARNIEGVELCAVAEATAMIPLLEITTPVIVVDAAVGAGPPGELIVVTPEQLATRGLSPVSSHGIGAVDAIALARVLYGSAVSPAIHVVAITIDPPARYVLAMSDVVARAVPRAVEAVLTLLGLPSGA